MAKKILTLPFNSDEWLNTWTALKDYITGGVFAEKFIRHDTKPFVRYYDKGNRLYREFPDEEKMRIWLEAYETGEMTAEIAAYEFTDGFTAPAPYSINVSSLKDNQYVLDGSLGTILSFNFQTVDGAGSELNESMDCYYTFKSTSGTHQTSKIYNAGATVQLNIDEYIHLGTNTITILLRGRSTGVTKTVVVTYYVVQLTLTTTFDISRSIQPNTNFSVTYTVTGQADKTVEFYLDGTLVATSSISSLESSATRTQVFNNTGGQYGPGKHSLQLRASMMAGDSQFYSNLLYYEFIVTGANLTTTVIQYVFGNNQSPLVGELPGLSGEQYVRKAVDWAYYSSDPFMKTATITWRLFDANGNETTLSTRNADVVEAETDSKPEPLQFMPTDVGAYNLQALVNNQVIESYTIYVIANTNGVLEATEGLTMKLSGLGRSNDEPPETLRSWSNNGYSAQFYNMPFNGNAGYDGEAVIFNNQAYAVIDNKPYSQEVAVQSNNGNVVEIDFMSFNVDYEDAVIFRIGEIGNGPYLAIYPNRAVLHSRLGSEIEARFKSEERVKLAFITHPNSEDHSSYPRFMFVQNQGVLAPGRVYDATDNFNIGSDAETSSNYGKIIVGDPQGRAGIKVFYLRTYNAVYNQWQGLNNYMIDSGKDLTQMIAKNDVFQAGSSDLVDIDKLEGMCALIKITSDLSPLIATQSKATSYGALEVTFPDDPGLNMWCENAQFSNAGQSTLGLHMSPSMHVKLDKNSNVIYDRDNMPLPKNRWAFRAGNVPEKKFRLQANPMDSSCCHNGAFLQMVNQCYPKVQVGDEGYVLRIPSQDYVLSGRYSNDMASKHGGSSKDYPFPYTINFVPDSRPAVVVWRRDNNTPYEMLGLYVIMEEKNSNFANGMRSIYSKRADDGTLDPFDFLAGQKGDRLWDNDGCLQMENLRNHQFTLFTSSRYWDTDRALAEYAYEKQYPDDDDQTQAEIDANWAEFGNEVVKPISATYNNQAAFDAVIFRIVNKWHMAAYYSRVLRQTCSDSLVRNLEWTRYERGGKWIPKWWDVDMQCGLQQSGACDAEPMTDRNTLQSNGTDYVLSGRVKKEDGSIESSWLWDALERNTEFMDAVRKIDQALYDVGWTYANITGIQDNSFVGIFSPALYNKDGISKYVAPYFQGNNYLTMFQGDRTSHRHWFERASYDYWDARWATGEFKDKAVYVRAGGASKLNTMWFTAGATSYFGYGQTQNIALSGLYHTKGERFGMTIQSETPILGNDPIQIYACNKLEEIDLHEIARYMWSTIQLDKCYDSVTGTLLKTLILGISKEDMDDEELMPSAYDEQGNPTEYTKQRVLNRQTNIAFTGFNLLTRIEYLDIQGLAGVNTIDISAMTNLTHFMAAGSGLLAFNPAPGCTLKVAEIPNTVNSIVMNGVSLTTNETVNGCAITWWDVTTQVTIPDGLRVLRFTAMGQDQGTQTLIHEWLQKIKNDPDAIANSQIQYTNIVWGRTTTLMEIEDLLILAKIPKAQRILTGYIKCRGGYTTDQMNTLMLAFGENIFNLNNSVAGICCDCETSGIIISASGDYTTVDETGVIEILQGSQAQLQAVGFPLLMDNPVYNWHVKIGGTYTTGTEAYPLVRFGNNTIHYSSGLVDTLECSALDAEYDIYCLNTNTDSSGTARIRIKSRIYPSHSETVYRDASISYVPEYSDGILQILDAATYVFDALHTRPDPITGEDLGYNGTMTTAGGGVWTMTGLDSGFNELSPEEVSQYAVSDTTNYLPGRTGFDEFKLQIVALPREEVNLRLDYTSTWKNGLRLTAEPYNICLISVILRVLTSDNISGNPVLFYAVDALGIAHEAPASFNSKELKDLGDVFSLKTAIGLIPGDDYKVEDLKDFMSGTGDGRNNVLKFMKNVSTLDVSECTGLTEFDATQIPWVRTLNMNDLGDNKNFVKKNGTGINMSESNVISSITSLGSYVDFYFSGKTMSRLLTLSLGTPGYLETPGSPDLTIEDSSRLTEIIL